MAVIKNFKIEKARVGTIRVTVSGVTDWTGLSAKLIAGNNYEETDPEISLSGSINPATNIITFFLDFEDTDSLIVDDALYYEVVIYNSDKSVLANCTMGTITVNPVVKIDPTI
jgi:hypothetical protein